MEIPDNWQEELMLHDWKMMRIERCRIDRGSGRLVYQFPNGIRYQRTTIQLDFEKAPAVVAALSDWEPKMKGRKKVATIKVNWDRFKKLTKGEYDDFKWRIYSLDI